MILNVKLAREDCMTAAVSLLLCKRWHASAETHDDVVCEGIFASLICKLAANSSTSQAGMLHMCC